MQVNCSSPFTLSCRFSCCAAFWWFCWSPGLGISYSHGCHQITHANRWIGAAQVQRPDPLCEGKCEKGGGKSAFQRTGFKLHSCLSCEHGSVCNIWRCTEIYRSLYKQKVACSTLSKVYFIYLFFCKTTSTNRWIDGQHKKHGHFSPKLKTDGFVLFLQDYELIREPWLI